ncbi:putative monooxygenase [Eremomyces bilateralis CBS 781.70]|uniref:Monooxygenase n=1 Tax=Eremomyces bilateralis CBS 781.70 TaxID=1392243 RepID=A0A6G1G0I9_9PEZI|nr:putative monooxygenase [Eremomyces bilateralis CBS 781.70]KAF1811627.1 putative monooxygenase [Eremomyces bilateralis CBS 781.70]
MTAQEPTRPLRVAVVGGGPGGLATGIALSALPNVEVTIFEQATQLREIGAGVTIGLNGWRVLGLLGAADGIKGHRRIIVDHRDGLTGTLVGATASSFPPWYHPRRVRRMQLQSALLDRIPPGVIQLSKRLTALENRESGRVRLIFEDGATATADLVVGADGIRSVVRENIFPDHKTTFTGTTVWRTLIPWKSMDRFPELNHKTTWFHSPVGFVMTTPVDDPKEVDKDTDGLFEVSIRKWVDPKRLEVEKFRWGVDAVNEKVLSNFKEYGPLVQEVLSHVPEGVWKEYSTFAGPRLEKLTGWNKVVLLGDASHPLSGAFGSGAAFAMEDGWILARAIEHTHLNGNPTADSIAKALEIFDSIRSSYYLRMYDYIDLQERKVDGAKRNASAAGISEWEAQLRVTVNGMIGDGLPWIYLNDIGNVWKKYLKGEAGDSVVSPSFDR